MVWINILFGALAGVLGALLGYAIANVAGRFFGLGEKSLVRTAVVVVSVIGAVNLLPPVFDAYLGDRIRSLLPAPDYYAELEAEPFWQRILKDNPELEPVLKGRIESAYAEGGDAAVSNAMFEFGAEIGATYVAKYMPLAREDQIPGIINYYVTTLEAMAELDRPLCYYWFFDPSGLSVAEQNIIGVIAGNGDLFLRLIETAYDEIPAFDRARAEDLQTESISNVQTKYGDGVQGYLMGSLVPQTTEHEAMYCSVYRDIYAFMQNQSPEDQVAQFRFVFG